MAAENVPPIDIGLRMVNCLWRGVLSQRITSANIIQDCCLLVKTSWHFLGQQRLAHSEIMPTGTNVNTEQYFEILRKLKTRFGRVRPHMERPLIVLDDARQHTSARSAAEIRRLGSTVLGRPSYRAILKPSRFHFFPQIGGTSERPLLF